MPTVLSTKKLSPAQRNLLLNSGISFVDYNAIKIENIDFNWQYDPSKKYIFTSQNAVASFLKKFSKKKEFDFSAFCVGEKTASRLKSSGIAIDETTANAAELGKIITEKYPEQEFVFFCGNKRREELISMLRADNIQIEEIEVYKTRLNEKTFQQEFEGVLFFSPSGVQSFTSKNNLSKSIAFCIGNTTASEAKKHTEKIKIATKPSVENVIVQVVKTLKND